MVKDLTVGKPETVLFKYSLPMFLSIIFQQLYSIADSVIAGKFAGEDALAAVGASYPLTMIFMAVAVGCNIGCSVIISQLFGAKQYKMMKTAIYTSLTGSVALSAVLTAAGLLVSKALMIIIKTPDNIFADGALYFRIYIGGLLFLFLYNICTGVFQSLGDSKTPLYFLIASSVGNVFLDLLFVAVFHWGVAGVAWATFIAQGIACSLAFAVLLRRIRTIPAVGNAEFFSWPVFVRVCAVAVPSILQQSFISIGNIVIQTLINGYGSPVIAGYSAAVKLNTFAITSFTTLANGLSGFTAQNLGAGRTERIRKGFRAGALMALGVAVPFFIAYFFFGGAMMLLFMEEGGGLAIHTGVKFMRIITPFYFVIAIKLMADGVLRGAGDMVHFMIATFTDLILRVLLSFLLSASLGTNGIWLSWPIGWFAAAVLSVLFYRSGKWKNLYDVKSKLSI